MIRDIKTPKELYEYCKEYGADDWEIVIREQQKMETPKGKGIYIVIGRKEVLIII